MLDRLRRLRATLKSPLYSGSVMTLVISIIMMVAFYAFFNKTTAWFTNNLEVDANGMKVVVETEGQLGIGSSDVSLINPDGSADFTGLDFECSCALTNCTVGNNNLVYYDLEDIVPWTGNIDTSDTSNVPSLQTAVENTHYIHRTIYLGSLYHSLDMQEITVSFANRSNIDLTTDDNAFLRATSCFIAYTDSSSVTHYINLNLYNQSSDTLEITHIAKSSPLAIDIYIYFDGALTDNGAYIIKSSTVNTTGINVGLTFTAVNAVTDTSD